LQLKAARSLLARGSARQHGRPVPQSADERDTGDEPRHGPVHRVLVYLGLKADPAAEPASASASDVSATRVPAGGERRPSL